jgi:radical SAM protein with 4Fe4S-binding SPASM domain
MRQRGIVATLVTGGRGLNAEVAQKMREADITAVSVSIDGPQTTHNLLRGFDGSHQGAIAALRNLHAEQIRVGVNTQVNRENLEQLGAIYDEIRQFPLYGWQVQLMVPMGRAADEPSLLLQPYDMLELFPILAELRHRADQDQIPLWAGDNVGYFGSFEDLLRGDRVPGGCSTGCGGGIASLGIEANGDIKACSAMASEGFVAGNVRNTKIRKLWSDAPELKFSRCFSKEKLWGFCKDCYYAEDCKAGCIWTANTILGRYGNNPYCHHRALEHLTNNQRERLIRVREAPGKIRDCALFVLETETAPSDWAERMRPLNGLTRVTIPSEAPVDALA